MAHYHNSEVEPTTFPTADYAHLPSISVPTLPSLWSPTPPIRTSNTFEDPALSFRYEEDPVLRPAHLDNVGVLANVPIHNPNIPAAVIANLPGKINAPLIALIPAAKDAAPKASRIAGRCHDRGPDVDLRFKCEFQICQKEFRRRYNLKVHMRKHTGETPYTCRYSGCGKKYLWRSSMAHHLKVHESASNSTDAANKNNAESIGKHRSQKGSKKLIRIASVKKINRKVGSPKGPVTNVQYWKSEDVPISQLGELPSSPISTNTTGSDGAAQTFHPHQGIPETHQLWGDRLPSFSVGCARMPVAKPNVNGWMNAAAVYPQDQEPMDAGEVGIVMHSSELYISDVDPREDN